MWIVIRSVKGGWEAHSIHTTEAIAREWVKCLSHDGVGDYSVAYLTPDIVSDVAAKVEGV